jgi:murein DD-endopeptidase MepM/ murein hydrolase activator NlpD
MAHLTEQQIIYIQQYLENEGLSYEPLKDEILDHLCCMTETKMQLGSSFHNAVQLTFYNFQKEEIHAIQKQIKYSSTRKKRIMKVTSFFTLGFLLTFSTIYWGFLQDPPSINPLAGDFEISSAFGMRHHPIQKKEKMHKGVDFKAPEGTPVVATADGVVVKTKFTEAGFGYGKHIVIQHDDHYQTLYAQLSEMDVKEGDVVKKGQVIGKVGSSGQSTAPHLHYEVLKDGTPQNPENYLHP